jgi:imidazolonepropionase-like amidohydrolase
VQRIEADVLLRGRGAPIERGVVVMDGARITYAGTAAGAPPVGDARVVQARTVMPGMWDCHAHFTGSTALDPVRWALEPPAAAGARSAIDAGRALHAGITSVREVGGLGVHLARAIADGSVPGPTIHAAGAMLSMTGGHGDLRELPLPVMRALSEQVPYLRVCDGEADCRRAVREMLRMGAQVIKVHASGGMMSALDDPHHQQFTDGELSAIVDEARRMDRVVAAHCHGKAGIMAALRTGVQTIEHGSWLDEEAADAMVAAGAMLVPTCFIGRYLREVISRSASGRSHDGDSADLPRHTVAKVAAAGDRHDEAVRIALAAGVRIAMGTDIFASHLWGRNAQEAVLLADLGMAPAAVVTAATANGPLTLGPMAPRSGMLVEGHDADVLTIDGDPLDDIAVLADPDRITGVWQAGQPVGSRG